MDTDWLTLLCAAALAFSVMNYVVLDGTDLGVGMLMGLTDCKHQRRAMAVSILPVWDANETWLVLGGGGLLALFPLAYAILLPALYVPFIVMFLALIARAMALEFRDYAPNERRKRIVDGVLALASLLTGLVQGMVLGTLVQGVAHRGGQYIGDGRDWLNPFPVFCGLVLVLGYVWLGTCWLYWRTLDELQQRSARQARMLALVVAALLLVLIAWTATLQPQYARRLADIRLWLPAGLIVSALGWVFSKGFHCRFDFIPLFAALGIFVLAFAVMLVALFPFIIPPDLTLSEAASSPTSQIFMLVGFAVLIPITLAYNTFGFRVFSGKVRVASDG
ncbi:cytochrome d ubiquinol oxidase subunit II [Pseudomonas siliginis]|jgi:cytochrome bd-type quinol oxidase subunit 2|uniref:cytochrome d ubiquinol oxidase subunit II n=1 Tax=Pseudomonas siliginis TaxID=2842346 RepID=UPI0020937D4E|nr:cytochrome d ubiquinol oxidase subunit II [Pseudomonas siliginis]USU02848.1 cytochrome d ubiquinol oxidase subunit II [Pseudomonas siliginis]